MTFPEWEYVPEGWDRRATGWDAPGIEAAIYSRPRPPRNRGCYVFEKGDSSRVTPISSSHDPEIMK